mgnify:CR=1 FL=1
MVCRGWSAPQAVTIPGLILKRSAILCFRMSGGCWKTAAKWEDLVDVTVFLTDMKRDFHTYNRVYAEYFKDHQPCRTTVGIDSLPTPIAIELKCIAVVDG